MKMICIELKPEASKYNFRMISGKDLHSVLLKVETIESKQDKPKFEKSAPSRITQDILSHSETRLQSGLPKVVLTSHNVRPEESQTCEIRGGAGPSQTLFPGPPGQSSLRQPEENFP